MKAAILVAQNEPLTVAEVDLPELAVGQILVKVEFSGICGKQLEEIDGKRGEDPYLPHLLGHEGAGVVVEAGPGVRKVKAGDHVVLHWIKGSGIDSIPPRFNWDGVEVSAGCVTTFSEYTVASENRVTPIPSDMELDLAALLGCAVTTGLGIVFNDASLKPGQSMAVFGVGGQDPQTVQVISDFGTRPAFNRQPVVYLYYQVGAGPIAPNDLVGGHQMRVLFFPFDHVSYWHNPATVSTRPGRPVHSVGGKPQKLFAVMVSNDSLDVVAKASLFSFLQAN